MDPDEINNRIENSATDPSIPPLLTRPWWGAITVAVNTGAVFHLGSTTLWVNRFPLEWRLSWQTLRDGTMDDLAVEYHDAWVEAPASATSIRLGGQKIGEQLRLTPALADRQVIARPLSPLYILPEDEATLYVSTALWLKIQSVDGADTFLDLPLHRPSDTWWGHSPHVGELCYASWTNARLSLDDLPRRKFRAVIRIHLQNRSRKPLKLEAINLPVLNLSLFSNEETLLWTDAVAAELRDSSSVAKVRLGGEAPAEAGPTALVATARIVHSGSVLDRAINALLE